MTPDLSDIINAYMPSGSSSIKWRPKGQGAYGEKFINKDLHVYEPHVNPQG